jgi:hypothetical protein
MTESYPYYNLDFYQKPGRTRLTHNKNIDTLKLMRYEKSMMTLVCNNWCWWPVSVP